jgi:hypothetical protein
LILGVDGGDILVNRTSFGRKAGKVNVNLELAKDPSGTRLGGHGRESKQDESFEPGAKSAFELNPSVFATPARAQAVMFHEVSHLNDYELTQRWVTEYEKRSTFVPGPGIRFFEKWVKGRTNPADAQLVTDIASGTGATTEARAYIRTAIAAFDAGAAVEATAQLVAYAKGMDSGKVAIPASPDKNPVLKQLRDEWAAYRGRLGRTEKAAFDAVVAAAVKASPKGWLATIKRG